MLTLSFASAINERTRPIMDGTVRPEGITLNTVVSDPAETFWRMLKFGDFDVSEMSISSLMMAVERGADLVAIPAFPARRFMHLELSCHRDSGIDHPSDLSGKRLAVGDYQQTAALWTRGVLEQDFGVSQYDIQWYMERTPDRSHAAATGFDLPDGISLSYIPPDKSMSTMLFNHEIDAAMVKRAMRKPSSNAVERSASIKVSAEALSKVTKPVFGDPLAEGKRFIEAHGFLPVNHTYVVRGDVAREHPWVPFNIFKAMVAAKEVAERDIIKQVPLTLVFAEYYYEKTRELLGKDLFPYGVRANRAALETLADYSHEQGLTKKRVDVDSLFAPSTLDF
ncbi:PhnD/SsuA/transferrin family substrate-binding protein [Mycolicibacterium litorale]|uniref:PhnD/SsuA/transferrin family substrate-binding protein n=1 Tax=Mycolicibacterium litorale TaxID=758802 RepID=UPI0039A3E2F4